MNILFVQNPRRAHKLLPLLEGLRVFPIKGLRDLLSLRSVKPGESTVVLIDSFGRWGLLGLAASWLSGAPLIMRLRGNFFPEARERLQAQSGLGRWFKYFLSLMVGKACLYKAEMLIFNSRYMAKAMGRHALNKTSAVVYNPFTPLKDNGREDSCPPLPEAGFRLLTVTNMHVASKVQPVTDAIEKWMPRDFWERFDIHWIICGAGPFEARLRERLGSSGLGERIHVVGRVQNMAPLYRWCHVLVHLTMLDAFPNVTMEAMTYGKPVITNNAQSGTLEQVFDGSNGFVIDGPGAFNAAIQAYASDADLRERHGQMGSRLVQKEFSLTVQRDAMREALEAFVRTRTRAA